MNRVYTAGPMTGKEMYNWPMFRFVADYLRDEVGLDVVTPIEIDEEMGVVAVAYDAFGAYESVTTTPEFDYESVLARDLEAVATCDSIVLLPGWNESSGAKRELLHALSLGLAVYVWEDLYV